MKLNKRSRKFQFCKYSKLRNCFGAVIFFSVFLNLLILSLSPHHYITTIQNEFLTKFYQAIKTDPQCPNMTIHKQNDNHFLKGMACLPRQQTKASCVYTADVYRTRPSITICKDQDELPGELCTISEKNINSTISKILVDCDFSVCDKNKDIFIEDINVSNGKLKKQTIAKGLTDATIENKVSNILLKAKNNGFPFIFVNCIGEKSKRKMSQMLTLLPKLQLMKKKYKQRQRVNVNIVLLDSISRAHFYRSLPKTVEYLREKQKDLNFQGHVLEFELFQAIHGHTHENEHAFFSGGLYPSNYTEEQIERSPTKPEVLFGIFKRAGYQTIHMEDLCWESYYGIYDSLKAHGWESLEKLLRSSNIDSKGITDSSCKILNRYGSNDQFNANKNQQICFNGRHHHQYLLDYLTRYIEEVEKKHESKPLFSSMALNVAHDDEGIRVQTLDKDLMNFIDVMSKQNNTVTIIYADHGNTYTNYQYMIEGRMEMYHPMMVAVIPKKVAEIFGEKAMFNLKTNQHRLFNLLDVREGLLEISKFDGYSMFKPIGIFGQISKKRVCDDLALTKGSICICKGWYIPVENSTLQLAIAEFAIGQLNTKIQELLMVSRKRDNQSDSRHLLFGFCQRLQLQSYTNMRQRKTRKGWLLTAMDIQVQSGNILRQDEIFTVNVESNEELDGQSLEMKLVQFNRISKYRRYKQCADLGVKLQLCVCNKRVSSAMNTSTAFVKPKTPLSKNHFIYKIIGDSSNVNQLNPCLLLIQRSYPEIESSDKTVKLKVYEIANICIEKNFFVSFKSFETKNIMSSNKLPMTMILQPRTIYFVTALKAGKTGVRVKLNLLMNVY